MIEIDGFNIYTKDEIDNFEESKEVVRVFDFSYNLHYLMADAQNSLKIKDKRFGYQFIMDGKMDEFNNLSMKEKIELCSKVTGKDEFFIHLVLENYMSDEEKVAIRIKNNEHDIFTIKSRPVTIDEIINMPKEDFYLYYINNYTNHYDRLINKYFSK